MAAFSNWLSEAVAKYQIDLHAWVLMTNHVHLLMTPSTDDGIGLCMQYIGRYYVRYFNYQFDRTGTLFEGRFKSSLVQSQMYLLSCYRYIELNPVRAGLVDDPADYVWSSHRANMYGKKVNMWTPHEEYLSLGSQDRERQKSYRSLFGSSIDEVPLTDIRYAINTGLALGNDPFRNEVEQLTGQKQTLQKRGPKKK
jgi:putative transposase